MKYYGVVCFLSFISYNFPQLNSLHGYLRDQIFEILEPDIMSSTIAGQRRRYAPGEVVISEVTPDDLLSLVQIPTPHYYLVLIIALGRRLLRLIQRRMVRQGITSIPSPVEDLSNHVTGYTMLAIHYAQLANKPPDRTQTPPPQRRSHPRPTLRHPRKCLAFRTAHPLDKSHSPPFIT